MAYNKYIRSGNHFEIYEYEKSPTTGILRRPRLPRAKPIDLEGALFLDNGDFADARKEQAFTKRRDNAQRASMAFKRLILSNLRAGENPLLLTLTFSENRTSIAESARFFHVFTQRMRRAYGESFRYIAVPEFQKRGAVHYHALFWGLDPKIYNEERDSRAIALLWGEGFVFLKETDGHDKLSSYLAKYMVKAIHDRRLFGKKAYFASRNVLRSTVSTGFPTWWVDEDFELSTLVPILEKEYMTKWLGKGRYRLYKLN